MCTFCSKKKAENPEGLYSMVEIAAFLKELYLLETRLKTLNLPKDSSKVVFAYYEKKLYEEHNMTDSLYRASFEYYMEDIRGLSKIYEIIADSLSLEERLQNAKIKKPSEDD